MTQVNFTPSNISAGNNSSSSELDTDIPVILLFLALLAIPIIVINFFVVFLVWKKESLRTPANICLASLACSDLLTGLTAIPLVITCTLLGTNNRVWCLAMDFINRLFSVSAILHLLVIAVERYMVIVHLFRPDDLLSRKKYAVIVSAVWLIPLCASLIQLSWLDWEDGVPYLNGVSRTEIIYDLVCIFGFVCLPLLVIIITYSRVFCVLRRHIKVIKTQASLFASQKHKLKEKRSTLIYTSMIVFYVIAWFPYFLIALSHDLGGGEMVTKIPEWLYNSFLFTRFSSPLANPILYTFFKQDFQKVIGAVRRGGFEAQVEQVPAISPVLNAIQMRTLRKCSNTAETC